MVDMKVFLAEENGVKLATKAKFWREATVEMMALEPKMIWAVMRENGWAKKEIDVAEKARRQVIKSIENNAKKKRDHEAAIKNIDMKVFLAVDANGLKLATKAAFWHAATDEMMAVPTIEIRAYLRAHGWSAKEIGAARMARVQVTPIGRKKARASARKSDRKRRGTPEGRKKANASARKSNRKVRSTPAGRKAHNASARESARKVRSTLEGRAKANASVRKSLKKRRSTPAGQLMNNARTATHRALKTFGMEKTEQTIHYLGCTNKQLETYFSKFMKPNIRIGVYDYLTHDSDPVYQIDHGIPVAIVEKNQHIEGLVDFCISYKNQRPIDARFNQLKGDAIILELIYPDCPAFPYINKLNGVDRVFQTVDEFLAYKGVSRSEFPLL